ncbi:MAG: hypothetical protein KG029_11840 [Bacteroidetes bacterium]|jgi:hypothetical protein|nr:hypothetical protein [Bacteroidota bacterium]
MRNKVLIILVVGFLSQILISCCKCGDSFTFENIYTGVTVIPYDNSGFAPKIAIDTVYKNAFGLGVLVNFESKPYANHFYLSLGFDAAMACDCIGDEFIYPDPISHMEIFMINQMNGQNLNVTDHFQIYGYTGELMTLDDFFVQRQSWHDGFQIELVKHDSIPMSAIFSAEVFFKSGKSFIGQTTIVNFY